MSKNVKKGRRIMLSESQFKEYVRRQLNESMGGNDEGAANACYEYAQKFRTFGDAIAAMGSIYDKFARGLKECFEVKGLAVGEIAPIKWGGGFGYRLTVDASNVQAGEEYEGNNDLFIDDLAHECVDDLTDSIPDFSVYMSNTWVSYKNGMVEVLPEPKDWCSFDRMDDFFSNN
jgi:hypothetical protein